MAKPLQLEKVQVQRGVAVNEMIHDETRRDKGVGMPPCSNDGKVKFVKINSHWGTIFVLFFFSYHNSIN